MVFNVPLPDWARDSAKEELKSKYPTWPLSDWFPRHFEMVFLADLYKRMASEDIKPNVLSLGCGKGLIEYLLALEGVSVLGVDKDESRIVQARSYQRLFNRVKPHRNLDSTLEYVAREFEGLDFKRELPDYRMVLANWIGPGEEDQGNRHDLRRYVAEPAPELIVISGESKCMRDGYTPTNMEDWGYRCIMSWYSMHHFLYPITAPSLYIGAINGGVISDLMIMEVWAKGITPLIAPKFKKVLPYPWEDYLKLDQSITKSLRSKMYVISDKAFI